ncbi:MAG: hypothetical protein IJ427_13335 [Lachnospiraceae bacterium]|nr:hypothetical protein [Lachnospiraceae bacterium]
MKRSTNTGTLFRKQKRYLAGRILALLLLFCLSPFSRVFYSMAVMGIYSKMNERTSLLHTEGIELSIPGGLTTLRSDWYPFVMTFEANSGFRRFTGNSSLDLTILYNFPAFSPTKGCSRLYDTASPYYNSFYGAYLVKDEDGGAYGFTRRNDGSFYPDASAVAEVPKYDFWQLVLSEFGLTRSNAVFDWNITDISKPLSYAGEDGFYRMDATLTVNGSSHEYNGFTQSYLQYGKPNFPVTNPLTPVPMYGRLYGKYLEDKQVSLFFYIVAADKEVLEDCDRELLSKSALAY